jgi:hypothetical protein
VPTQLARVPRGKSCCGVRIANIVSLIHLSLQLVSGVSVWAYILANNNSVLRCIEHERVIGIAGIGEISTAGAQRFLDPVDCFISDAAPLTRLNVTVQFDGVIANRVHGHGIYVLSEYLFRSPRLR